ncbi:alpha/beta hydrolase [Acidovorax sp.]|uniref:alpha/beta hydrolase n=1 Tax=Acidovorax sp. TaxID=1872122 RepID=UPI003A0FE959
MKHQADHTLPSAVGQAEPLPDRREFLRIAGTSAAAGMLSTAGSTAFAAAPKMGASVPPGADNFYTSNQVIVQQVSFKNQYRMTVTGTLFVPSTLDRNKRTPAIVVGHPMGAVKEQSANLYATKMAERGFVALSVDLAFWGGSEGQPRNAVSPDMYAETFSAAVDFLGSQAFVDRQQIGAIGVCGSGSFVISAAKIDPRLKAIATVSMYDMGAANRNALNHSQTLAQRKQIIASAAAQRDVEFNGGAVQYTGGTVLRLKADTHPIQREFFDFYRTPRGEFTPLGASSQTTTMPTLSSNVKFMNFYPFNDIETISPRPLLFIAGDQAHSKEFSEDAYKRAAEPKELHYVPGAGHVDLYDRVTLIPWDKLASFFDRHLIKARV